MSAMNAVYGMIHKSDYYFLTIMAPPKGKIVDLKTSIPLKSVHSLKMIDDMPSI